MSKMPFPRYSQFLTLRRLCSDDSDFSNKPKEMCQFFEKRSYPASVIQTAQRRRVWPRVCSLSLLSEIFQVCFVL